MKVLFVVIALVLALGVPAWAAEIEGKIQSIETFDRALVLDDGTRLFLAEGLTMDALKEGARVKASYEDRDGKRVVTTFEVSE
jgi:uncharacterized protein DUF1344